jgi:hypothetical protein
MSVTINGSGIITGLDADGISAQPVFAGNVLQVVQGSSSSTTSTTSTTAVTTNISASITPSAASSKVLVTFHFLQDVETADGRVALQIYRNGVDVSGDIAYLHVRSQAPLVTMSASYLDSPNSTSSVTYELYFRRTPTVSATIQMRGDLISHKITLMEIAG